MLCTVIYPARLLFSLIYFVSRPSVHTPCCSHSVRHPNCLVCYEVLLIITQVPAASPASLRCSHLLGYSKAIQFACDGCPFCNHGQRLADMPCSWYASVTTAYTSSTHTVVLPCCNPPELLWPSTEYHLTGFKPYALPALCG